VGVVETGPSPLLMPFIHRSEEGSSRTFFVDFDKPKHNHKTHHTRSTINISSSFFRSLMMLTLLLLLTTRSILVNPQYRQKLRLMGGAAGTTTCCSLLHLVLGAALAVTLLLNLWLAHQAQHQYYKNTRLQRPVKSRQLRAVQGGTVQRQHAVQQPPPPLLCWLLSFPNSGSALSSRRIQEASSSSGRRIVASNYADETVLGRAGVRRPVYEDQPEGPFWILVDEHDDHDNNQEQQPPSKYILTNVCLVDTCPTWCTDAVDIYCTHRQINLSLLGNLTLSLSPSLSLLIHSSHDRRTVACAAPTVPRKSTANRPTAFGGDA